MRSLTNVVHKAQSRKTTTNARKNPNTPPAKLLAINVQNQLQTRVSPALTNTAWYQFDAVDPASLFVVSNQPRENWPTDVVTRAHDVVCDDPDAGPPVAIEHYRCVIPALSPVSLLLTVVSKV